MGRTGLSLVREAFTHGRIGMALLAGSLTAAAQAALRLPLSLHPLLIAALGTFVVYSLNHRWDEREDAINTPGRRAWRVRSASVWRVLMASASAGAFLLAWHGGPAVLLVTGALALVGLGYNLTWPGSSWRVKGRVGLNLALIATGWALMGIGLPLAYADAPLTLQAVLMALWVGGISGLLASVFDLRDLPGDAALGLGTLPVLLGPGRAHGLLAAWCVLSGATVAGAVALRAFPPDVLVSILAPGGVLAWLIRWPPYGSPSARSHAESLLWAEIVVCWFAFLVWRA